MKTDPATLPQYLGRPVPWVIRWSNEQVRDMPEVAQVGSDLAFIYQDRNENRDRTGVLWQREGITRGGEPQWRNVSTYRQRASMLKCLCQVCGKKIDNRPIRWLMALGDGTLDGLVTPDPGNEWNVLPVAPGESDETITMQPPTCDGCIELALELCPHLKRNGWQILKVLEYEPWGAFGEIILQTEHGVGVMQTFAGYDRNYGPEFAWTGVLAKQAVVRLTKYVVEETHRP